MSSKAALLRERLKEGRIVRIVGAHNGLGAKLIARFRFDGIWASGLEISTAHGLPDANILTMTENLEAARIINEATQLPVICDCDTGYGNASNVKHMVRKYEAAGLAAIVIEDKRFPKVNSFIPGRQELAPIEEFMGRLQAAKEAQREIGLLVFARVEALIAGWGLEEALRRAAAYVEAGADGIVIHSKSPKPDEVFSFAKRWNRAVPLVAIPTTYYGVSAQQLEREGFSMVIYANHGLRASLKAMESTFRSIDEQGSTAAIEKEIASLNEVFEIQGMNDMKEDAKRFSKTGSIQAIIPAARDHQFQPDLKELLKDKPLCMLDIGGKTVLEHQMDLLHSVGVADVTVVSGHLHEKIEIQGAQLLYNPHYQKTQCAQSILFARDHLKGKVVLVYSDVLFDRQILERLFESPHPITLVIDRSYRNLPARNKPLDLVAVEWATQEDPSRRLDLNELKAIRQLGKKLNQTEAGHEFIGVAFFREKGCEALKQGWDNARKEFREGRFYEAPTVEEADLTDLMQYLIDRGFPVYGMEIEQGWSEIHSLSDYQRIQAHFHKPPLVLSGER